MGDIFDQLEANYQNNQASTLPMPSAPAPTPSPVQKTDIFNQLESNYQASIKKPLDTGSVFSARPEVSGLDYGTGLVSSLLRGATFGLSDEAIANVASAGDFPHLGRMQGTYDAALASQRQNEKDFQMQHPYQQIGGELMGSLANPLGLLSKAGTALGLISKAPQVAELASVAPEAASLASRVIGGAKTAAGTGAAYGFGTGEGGVEDRLKNAASTALITAPLGGLAEAVPEALSGIGGYLKNQALGFDLSRLGVTANALKTAVKTGAGKYIQDQTGMNPVINAMEQIRPSGVLSQFDPSAAVDIADSKISDLGSKVRDILTQADASVPGQPQFIPTFENAQTYVDGLTGGEQTTMQRALDREKALLLGNNLDGSLASLQDAKISFGHKGYDPKSLSTKSVLNQKIALDLKQTIENSVDGLAASGLVPAEYAGQVKSLNQENSYYQTVKPFLVKKTEEAAVGSVPSGIKKYVRTTGGPLGVPSIAGAGLGVALHNPLLAIGGLATGGILSALTSPTGELASAAALRGFGGAASDFSGGINTILGQDLGGTSVRDAIMNAFAAKAAREQEAQNNPMSMVAPGATQFAPGISIQATPPQAAPAMFGNIPMDRALGAVANIESSGNTNAIGPETKYGTAKGKFQLMDKTAQMLGVQDPFNETQAQAGAQKYLSQLYRQFGDPDLAVMAYNWGPGNVQKYLSGEKTHVPPETIAYLNKFHALTQPT